MLKNFVAFLLLISSPMCFACSCAEISSNDKFDEYVLVFVGTRISKNPYLSFGNTKYTFDVNHLYQGPSKKEVTLWTGKFSSSCGANYEKEVEYLVMAYKSDGKLTASICSSWEKEGNRKHNTRVVEEYFAKKLMLKNAK